MKVYVGSSPKVEDIMTPRSLLKCVDEARIGRAQNIAEKNDFDAVPILKHGQIRKYWSRSDRRPLPITRRHHVLHDTPIEEVLPRLGDHLIQFVYYRSEIVGLVDVSDLNKPVARLTWLRPLLECEQAIVTRSQRQGFSEETISEALGRAAKDAKKFRRKAAQEDLSMPLLGFAYFRDILKAAARLGVIDLSDEAVNRLSRLRNKSAHVGQPLIEKKDQIKDLIWALKTCRRILRSAG